MRAARGEAVQGGAHAPVVMPRRAEAAPRKQRQAGAQRRAAAVTREDVHLAAQRREAGARGGGGGLVVGQRHEVHRPQPGQPLDVPEGPQAVALVRGEGGPVREEEHIERGLQRDRGRVQVRAIRTSRSVRSRALGRTWGLNW